MLPHIKHPDLPDPEILAIFGPGKSPLLIHTIVRVWIRVAMFSNILTATLIFA